MSDLKHTTAGSPEAGLRGRATPQRPGSAHPRRWGLLPLVVAAPASGIQLPTRGTLVALALVSAVVAGLLYTQRPTVTRRTVLSLVPWIVVGASVREIHSTGAYPDAIAALFVGPSALLVAFIGWGLAWFGMLQFSLEERANQCVPTYLGTVGAGAVVVLASVVLLLSGLPGRLSLFWLVMAPVLSGAVAFLVLILFGFWYTDAAAYTGLAGGLVVFAHTLDALVTVVGTTMFGLSIRTPSALVSSAFTDGLQLASLLGVSETFVWVWLLLAGKMAFAILVVALLTRYVREEPSMGNLTLGVVTAAGLVPGVNTLHLIL